MELPPNWHDNRFKSILKRTFMQNIFDENDECADIGAFEGDILEMTNMLLQKQCELPDLITIYELDINDPTHQAVLETVNDLFNTYSDAEQ